jgi:hypothetical protein
VKCRFWDEKDAEFCFQSDAWAAEMIRAYRWVTAMLTVNLFTRTHAGISGNTAPDSAESVRLAATSTVAPAQEK